MHGSLALKNGILYVGRWAKTARVTTFDMDGRRLETDFQFRDERAGRSAAAGLAVDDDHRIWVADTPAARLRAFTLFGKEVVSIGGGAAELEDARGRLGAPVDVVAGGEDDDLVLWVASAGRRRHAVQRFHALRGRVASLRAGGDPRARFQDVCGLALQGEHLWVCERAASRVQVFRAGEFHYSIEIEAPGGERAEPRAVAVLDDGRLVLAVGGARSALLLVDGQGRVLRVLAEAGEAEGSVLDPSDLALDPGPDERSTRIAVIDRDGERVQVFNLRGRCYGAFPGS